MASKFVSLQNSAMPYQNKINILIADLVRVMRNVSLQCEAQERSRKVQEFLLRLQHSGYNKAERHKIYIKARKKFNNMKENARNGTCPMYRSKFWNRNERTKQKAEKMRTWYSQNGKYESVFFVNYTERSQLANDCQKVLNNIGLKIKVVEKGGKTLKQELVRSNPFEKLRCDKKCEICENHPKINCRAREVVYEIKCEGKHTTNQEKIYGGETSRSISERFQEHRDDIQKKKIETPVYKHFKDEHGGVEQPIQLKVLKTCYSDAMLRQATEAVYIRENDPIMNRKKEIGNMDINKKRKASNSNANGTVAPSASTN